jgi:transcriptional regulator of acetoin/glycerol metabolism
LSLLQAYLWPGNIRELRNVLERVFIENQSEVIGARAFREWVVERQDFSPGDWGPDRLSAPSASLALPYPLSNERVLLSRPDRLKLTAPAATRVEMQSRTTQPVNLEVASIREACQAANGNLSAAARLLGVHRATLYRYLQKHGLSREDLSD